MSITSEELKNELIQLLDEETKATKKLLKTSNPIYALDYIKKDGVAFKGRVARLVIDKDLIQKAQNDRELRNLMRSAGAILAANYLTMPDNIETLSVKLNFLHKIRWFLIPAFIAGSFIALGDNSILPSLLLFVAGIGLLLLGDLRAKIVGKEITYAFKEINSIFD